MTIQQNDTVRAGSDGSVQFNYQNGSTPRLISQNATTGTPLGNVHNLTSLGLFYIIYHRIAAMMILALEQMTCKLSKVICDSLIPASTAIDLSFMLFQVVRWCALTSLTLALSPVSWLVTYQLQSFLKTQTLSPLCCHHLVTASIRST